MFSTVHISFYVYYLHLFLYKYLYSVKPHKTYD